MLRVQVERDRQDGLSALATASNSLRSLLPEQLETRQAQLDSLSQQEQLSYPRAGSCFQPLEAFRHCLYAGSGSSRPSFEPLDGYNFRAGRIAATS